MGEDALKGMVDKNRSGMRGKRSGQGQEEQLQGQL
jgi:hypothetical protein